AGGRGRRRRLSPPCGGGGGGRGAGGMSPLELVRLALSRLRRARVRAALTMLGGVIGVGSVVGLVSVGRGTTARITAQLNSLGTNLLTISPSGGGGDTLTLDDATAIAALDGLAAVAPEIQTQGVVATSATNTTTTSIVGTSAQYAQVRAYDVWQGTFLSPVEVAASLRSVVLGASVATNLGLGADSVGSNVTIEGIPFQVVGILQPKGGSGVNTPRAAVLIP